MRDFLAITKALHMAILHRARLVETRKDGRWIYYRLAKEDGLACVAAGLDWLGECLAKEPQIRLDAKALKKIRKTDRNELCAHYRN